MLIRATLPILAGISLASPCVAKLDDRHSPAAGPCPTVAEAITKMKVPAGYRVENFAAEPMVVNPVAMSWDGRGRLWVVELYEYPLGAPQPNAYAKTAQDEAFAPVIPAGERAPRDRVLILEDTDHDGKADKRTVFLEGLSLATAILPGYGGVFVGQAPNLFFFKDTNGDDKADDYKTVLTGFGLEDRHELLNSFTWGPDGQLYFTHGVFTHSRVRRPGTPEDSGMKLDAGIFRVRLGWEKGAPVALHSEVYADGTSNPWGVDFDRAGHAFVEACVIDHLFHMQAGGLYERQGGTPENPYAYELLPSIVNHKHFRAAYAGIAVYDGGAYPADTNGHLFFGNIHDNAIHEEAVTPVGATFKAQPIRDFLRAEDGWFRPVSVQTGPDGFLWIMDWCDKYPCYQNAQADPAGVDREKGRIWRVVAEKAAPPKVAKIHGATEQELVQHLSAANNWVRRQAALALRERFFEGKITADFFGKMIPGNLNHNILRHQFGDKKVAADLAASNDPVDRLWAARLGAPLEILGKLAADPEPMVRAANANALRLLATPHLTVTKPASKEPAAIGPAWETLLRASAKSEDRTLPFLIWMALEPNLAAQPGQHLSLLSKNAAATKPLSLGLTKKAVRRLCDTRQPENMDLILGFLWEIGSDEALLTAGLEGLLKGQEAATLTPAKTDPTAALAAWQKHTNQGIRNLGGRLATLWGDPAAVQALVQRALSAEAAVTERITALQTLRKLKSPGISEALTTLLKSPAPEPLMQEILLAAGEIGDPGYPGLILATWEKLSPNLKATAAQVLTGRPAWAGQLLDAVADQRLKPGQITPTIHRWLALSAPADLKERSEKLLGRWNETKQEVKEILAAKRQACLEGEPDLIAGKNIFMATCGVCHVFHGGGKNVGPDLIGNGRSSLDALLNNIIDPNQVIGRGYENVTITTKDGRTVAGRVTEDTPTQVKLVGINETTEIVARDQIAQREDSLNSLMPEGFGSLPDEIFRNLVWYILAPPEEGPLTAQKRADLSQAVTAEPKAASKGAPVDWESVSLWNPEWKVTAPEFEGTPRKLSEHFGQKNVLMLHPFDQPRGRPAVLQRSYQVVDKNAVLMGNVASGGQGDWKLAILVDGKTELEQDIGTAVPRWKEFRLPLAKWAGKKIDLQLQGQATGWAWEFGYWRDVRIESK